MRSPCTSILSRVVVCGSGLGPEATSAASAPAGTPSARLVNRVAAVRDCGDFVFGTACLRLLMWRSEEHTSELQSLMRISYAVFCLKKKKSIMAFLFIAYRLMKLQTT